MNKRITLGVVIIAIFISLLFIGCGSKQSQDNISETAQSVINTEDSEIKYLRNRLKEEYGISEPREFHQDFSTEGQMYVVISNATPPATYAVEYAKAYMEPGDLHYICNLYLNTTTQICIMDLPLENGDYSVEVLTHEYSYLEETDVRTIGNGMLLKEQYFSLNTGKELSADTKSDEVVNEKELIEAVEKAIEDSVHENEKTSVTFDGKNLIVYDDLSDVDFGVIPPEDFAETCIGSLTDSILELEDKYYNSWEKIIVDFGDLGKAVLDKSMVVDQGYGKFFQYTGNILQ